MEPLFLRGNTWLNNMNSQLSIMKMVREFKLATRQQFDEQTALYLSIAMNDPIQLPLTY